MISTPGTAVLPLGVSTDLLTRYLAKTVPVVDAVELEVALRNEIHDRHLALLELQSSRSGQDVGSMGRTVSALLPAGTRRRLLVASVTRIVRRG